MAKQPLTEQDMLGLLARRHAKTSGNGPAFVFASHVKETAGHGSRRTIDALAMSLWESRGLLIDAFEIKCSRSDWLRELKDPAKAEAFADKVDRFWLAAADDSVVADGELPGGWGLLVARGNRLVVKKEASVLHGSDATKQAPLPPGVDRAFLAAWLRATARSGAPDADALTRARQEGEAAGRAAVEAELRRDAARLQDLQRRVEAFEGASGLTLAGFAAHDRAASIGRAVRVLLEENPTSRRGVREQLARQARAARETADRAQAQLDALDAALDGDA